MDLSTFISFVALVAAAASLTWQRRANEEQRKAALEENREKLIRARREVASLTTQMLALVTANATKYARLQSRIERLLAGNVTGDDRQSLTEHLARVRKRMDAYNKQSDEAAEQLNELGRETGSNNQNRDDYERRANALQNANAYLELTQKEESRAIEDEISRIERKIP
jgi:chromosome segregation ATPase